MRRILLKIQYNGLNFSGFQMQPNLKTIQGELVSALKKLFNSDIEVYGCSRTDSGVSAEEYYCHFDIENDRIPANKICYALNDYLPHAISALESRQVSDDFHARFNVKNKTYMYTIYVSPHIMPLIDDFAVRIDKMPNIKEMHKASTRLIGTHDFKAFKSQDPSKKEIDSVRTINFIKFQQKENIINIYINGNGFLYNMVRIIVGTLLKVGEGKLTPNDVEKILESKDRTLAGKTMPAKALRLKEVNYKNL